MTGRLWFALRVAWRVACVAFVSALAMPRGDWTMTVVVWPKDQDEMMRGLLKLRPWHEVLHAEREDIEV